MTLAYASSQAMVKQGADNRPGVCDACIAQHATPCLCDWPHRLRPHTSPSNMGGISTTLSGSFLVPCMAPAKGSKGPAGTRRCPCQVCLMLGDAASTQLHNRVYVLAGRVCALLLLSTARCAMQSICARYIRPKCDSRAWEGQKEASYLSTSPHVNQELQLLFISNRTHQLYLGAALAWSQPASASSRSTVALNTPSASPIDVRRIAATPTSQAC